MKKKMVLGSVEWVIAFRNGAFRNQKPIPAVPAPPKLSAQERASLAFGLQDHDGKPCPYCGHPMEIGARWFPTRDHVYPRHLGGTRHEENVLIVCSPCNQDKGGKTLIQFARALTNKQDPRAARVWAIFKSRPPFHAGETSRIVSGWEKARRSAEQIAARARKNGQEHAP